MKLVSTRFKGSRSCAFELTNMIFLASDMSAVYIVKMSSTLSKLKTRSNNMPAQ